MCIRHSTLGSHVLGATVSFRREPRLELVHGALRDADAIFWTDGERWFVTRRYGDEVPLEVGATLDIQGERFFVEENRVVEAGQVTLDNGRAEPLLHLRVHLQALRGPRVLHVRTRRPSVASLGLEESAPGPEHFQTHFAAALASLAASDPRIHALTAAMAPGCSLDTVREQFPDRVHDVGIAEPHCITAAAARAAAGLRPVVNL
jgi:hypothetical protein